MGGRLQVGLTVTEVAALARLSAKVAATAALRGHKAWCTRWTSRHRSASAKVALAAGSAVCFGFAAPAVPAVHILDEVVKWMDHE
jgi:hypothetical protein